MALLARSWIGSNLVYPKAVQKAILEFHSNDGATKCVIIYGGSLVALLCIATDRSDTHVWSTGWNLSIPPPMSIAQLNSSLPLQHPSSVARRAPLGTRCQDLQIAPVWIISPPWKPRTERFLTNLMSFQMEFALSPEARRTTYTTRRRDARIPAAAGCSFPWMH